MCQTNDEFLAAQMLDVTREIRSRLGLDERGEFRVNGSRGSRERFERRGGRIAALEPTPERLRYTRSISRLRLGHRQSEATLAEADPDSRRGRARGAATQCGSAKRAGAAEALRSSQLMPATVFGCRARLRRRDTSRFHAKKDYRTPLPVDFGVDLGSRGHSAVRESLAKSPYAFRA